MIVPVLMRSLWYFFIVALPSSTFLLAKNMSVKQVQQCKASRKMVKSCADFGSNYPNKEVVQHFYNQLNVNVQSIQYLAWLFYCIITLSPANSYTFMFSPCFQSRCGLHTHTCEYTRKHFLFPMFDRQWSKDASKKTSCAMSAKSLIVSYARHFYRKNHRKSKLFWTSFSTSSFSLCLHTHRLW